MIPLLQLLTGGSVAGMVFLLCLVGALGLLIGSLKVRGISIGITGALFAGIAVAHLCFNEQANGWLIHRIGEEAMAGSAVFREKVLDFLRDGGLVLFVFAVGMQAGPSFLASFRANGLVWNLAAVAVVLGGFGLALASHKVLHLPAEAAVGFYSGAVTNTPGLSAATAAMDDRLKAAATRSADPAKITTSAYAVAYPLGVLGVILSMVVLRMAFRIRPLEESQAFAQEAAARHPPPRNANLLVSNPGLEGRRVQEVLETLHNEVVISRLKRGDEVLVPTPDTVLRKGDLLHAVGAGDDVGHLRMLVGEESAEDIRLVPARLAVRRLVVSRDQATGRNVIELGIAAKFQVNITRIERAGLEFVATDQVDLLIGDVLTAVGGEEDLKRLAAFVGDSARSLDRPRLDSLFTGILLGCLLGVVSIPLSGLPAPVKFGMAGGPLLVALLLGALGRLGPFQFHFSHGALHFMREFGIALFLACVGLKAGDRFFGVAFSQEGALWIACGAVITILPVLLVGYIMRRFLKANFAALCGVLAGSMTDPPALAFANATAQSEAPGLAYAAVYPTTMILRILLAQVFVILFFLP